MVASHRSAHETTPLTSDDEILRYLTRRGIEPGVVEMLRVMLASRPVSEPPRIPVQRFAEFEKRLGEKRRKQRYSPQRECVLHAVNDVYPHGIPEAILAGTLKREVGVAIAKGKGQPWHIAVSEQTISDHIDALLSEIRPATS